MLYTLTKASVVANLATMATPMKRFRFRGALGRNPNSLDLLSYNPRIIAYYDSIEVDLKELSFIHPMGVVGLLCFVEKLVSLGRTISLSLPENPDVKTYLANIQVLPALESITPVAASDEVRDSLMPRLTTILPIRRFSSENDVELLAQDVETAMSSMGGLLAPCYNILAELASNTVQHSLAECGWAFVQCYQYHEGCVIELAIGDCGIGIRRSLRKNTVYSLISSLDDAMALRLATNEGVSRFSDPYRGFGLFTVRTEIKAPERRLTLRSGSGCLMVYGNGMRRSLQRAPIVGVLAEARIPC